MPEPTQGKKLLLLMRHPPYQGLRATEALEVALVGAVFDLPTSLLFRDNGVWQLLANQNADELGTRTHSRLLTALPDYEISGLFACADSLAQRGITEQQLALPVTIISAAEQQQLIAQHQLVVND